MPDTNCPPKQPNRKARRLADRATDRKAKNADKARKDAVKAAKNAGESSKNEDPPLGSVRGRKSTSNFPEESLPPISEVPEGSTNSVAPETPLEFSFVGEASLRRLGAALAARREDPRTRWFRGIRPIYKQHVEEMVKEFERAGITLWDDEATPATMYLYELTVPLYLRDPKEAIRLLVEGLSKMVERGADMTHGFAAEQALRLLAVEAALLRKVHSGRDMAGVLATYVRDSAASVGHSSMVSAHTSIASVRDSVVSALNRLPLPTADSAYMRDSLLALRDSPTLQTIVGSGTIAGLSALGGNGEIHERLIEAAWSAVATGSAVVMLTDVVPPGSVASAMQSFANVYPDSIRSDGYSPPSVFTEDEAVDSRTTTHDDVT